MNAVSRRRRLSVRIALLAMLWQLLLPWSQAHSAADGLVPVCTATGLKWVALDDTSDESRADSERKRCALCWFEHQTPALLDAHDPLIVALGVVRAAPALNTSTFATTESGIPPPIRAPPSRS